MKKRPKTIEKVEHGTFSAPIKFDSDTGVFSFSFGSENLESTNLVDVRAFARQTLRAAATLDWKPIMEVSFGNRDQRVNNLKNCVNMECQLERYYVAWDGRQWVKTAWVVMPPGSFLCVGPHPSDARQSDYPMDAATLMAQRVAKSQAWHVGKTEALRFPLVREGPFGDTEYFVPYTQQNWDTIVGIQQKIRELRTGIHKLLTTEPGWIRLAHIATAGLLGDKST